MKLGKEDDMLKSCLHCSYLVTYNYKLRFTNWVCDSSALCLAVYNARLKTTKTY